MGSPQRQGLWSKGAKERCVRRTVINELLQIRDKRGHVIFRKEFMSACCLSMPIEQNVGQVESNHPLS